MPAVCWFSQQWCMKEAFHCSLNCQKNPSKRAVIYKQNGKDTPCFVFLISYAFYFLNSNCHLNVLTDVRANTSQAYFSLSFNSERVDDFCSAFSSMWAANCLNSADLYLICWIPTVSYHTSVYGCSPVFLAGIVCIFSVGFLHAALSKLCVCYVLMSYTCAEVSKNNASLPPHMTFGIRLRHFQIYVRSLMLSILNRLFILSFKCSETRFVKKEYIF